VSLNRQRGTQLALDRWAGWQRNAGRSSSEVQEHLKQFNAEYFPITVQQHLTLLETVGFRTVELFWFSQMQAGFLRNQRLWIAEKNQRSEISGPTGISLFANRKRQKPNEIDLLRHNQVSSQKVV